MYAIEGFADGEWSEDNVISSGDPEEVNRYDTWEDAQAALDELADIFLESEGLRIVEVDNAEGR